MRHERVFCRLSIVKGKPLIVAIDGPAGAGKSATAREVALHLGVPYLDTGAMYRAVALAARRAGVAFPPDEAQTATVIDLARRLRLEFAGSATDQRVLLDSLDVTDELRTPECSQGASIVSTIPEVRHAMVALQRALAAATGGVVEGRDIGTVVFPDATLKVFLTAPPEVRARRRHDELQRRGIKVRWEDVLADQHERDRRDSTRTHSPLRPAEGSIVLDTGGLTLDAVVARLLDLVRRTLTG